MNINVVGNVKVPVKSLSSGDIFKTHTEYFMIIDYDKAYNPDEIMLVNLKTGRSDSITVDANVFKVDATMEVSV